MSAPRITRSFTGKPVANSFGEITIAVCDGDTEETAMASAIAAVRSLFGSTATQGPATRRKLIEHARIQALMIRTGTPAAPVAGLVRELADALDQADVEIAQLRAER